MSRSIGRPCGSLLYGVEEFDLNCLHAPLLLFRSAIMSF